MLYTLLAPLGETAILFNLFTYITFRTGGAVVTAFALVILSGPAIIAWLKSKQPGGQPIRTDGPETHFSKKGTPTMGGVMILGAVIIATLLWADLANAYVWIVSFVTLGYGLIGFGDDYLKLTKKNPKGLPGRQKLVAQVLIGLAAAAGLIWAAPDGLKTHLAFPFFKEALLDLGWVLFPIFAMLVMVGSSNAVNLTDGLDGLASGLMMIAAAVFFVFCYVAGHAVYAPYLQLHYTPGSGEVGVVCGALFGACMGFLWFNCQPAQVFMGDTGSLSLGGAIGTIAVVVKHEIVLAIVGGVFVLETVSVMLQVASFKLTGRRIFRMAPIHHHFEKAGWPESRVVIRFWIIGLVLALAGLSTLKLR